MKAFSGSVLAVQDLTEGPWRQSNLDAGASMIITVPAPMGGAVVVGESVIAYLGQGQQMKCTEINPTIIRVQMFLLILALFLCARVWHCSLGISISAKHVAVVCWRSHQRLAEGST